MTYEMKRVWFSGDLITVEIGQKFFVGHCGSGRTVFGEMATLTNINDKHLTFTTDSGAKIRSSADNLHSVSGKAGAQGNFISPITNREYIYQPLFVY